MKNQRHGQRQGQRQQRQRQRQRPGQRQHQPRGLRRSRSSVTVAGQGHGPSRCGVLGPPMHRPAVAVGARRASAPARLPSATRIANPTRSPTVASGRLDGLPPPRCTLLRHALPEGAPLENVLFANSEVHRHILKDRTPTVAPLLVLHRARESRAALSTRLRAPAGVPSTVLRRQRPSFNGHNAVGGSPGNGIPEKRVTATKKAVETPGGGRDRTRATKASRHRRAASRSGGATSAEWDGRPVQRILWLSRLFARAMARDRPADSRRTSPTWTQDKKRATVAAGFGVGFGREEYTKPARPSRGVSGRENGSPPTTHSRNFSRSRAVARAPSNRLWRPGSDA
jgi:hypothetical protein